jgi:UDP-N-acetylglucosamine:LPS N-acetylglucosamine transferase
MERAGAVLVAEGPAPQPLARALARLAGDPGLRARLAAAAGRLARPDAAERVAERALELASRRR